MPKFLGPIEKDEDPQEAAKRAAQAPTMSVPTCEWCGVPCRYEYRVVPATVAGKRRFYRLCDACGDVNNPNAVD